MVQCSLPTGPMFPVHEVDSATYWILFLVMIFDIIYLCYSIMLDNNISIKGVDIIGSQFLEPAQIFLEKTLKKSEKVFNVPHSPLPHTFYTHEFNCN